MDSVPDTDWMAAVTTAAFACSSEFANDGGKLIVVPRSALRSWHGSIFWWTEPLRGRWGARLADWIEARFERFTDWARAHRTRDWFDVLRVGHREAIVVGYQFAEIYARWLRMIPEERDYLLAIEYGDQGVERGIAAFIRGLPDSAWTDLGLRIVIPDEDLLLFHSGTNGAWLQEVGSASWACLGTGFAWRLRPGTYALHQASAHLTEPGCAGHAEVCWLRPA